MKVSDATQLKIDKMWEEIGKVENKTLRANLRHTFEKVLNFLDDEFDGVSRAMLIDMADAAPTKQTGT